MLPSSRKYQLLSTNRSISNDLTRAFRELVIPKFESVIGDVELSLEHFVVPLDSVGVALLVTFSSVPIELVSRPEDQTYLLSPQGCMESV